MTNPTNLDLSGLEEPPAHSEGFSIRLSTALALIEAVRERDALKAELTTLRAERDAAIRERDALRWTCKGRLQSLPEPAECNWPICGCDPSANKVIEHFQECGQTLIDEAELIALRAEHDALKKQREAMEMSALAFKHLHENLEAALEAPARPDLDASGALRKAAENLRLLRDVYGVPCKEAELEFIAASTPHNVLALFAERDALKASLSDDGLERGLAGVMMDVLWPEFGGNHRDAEFWHETAEIVQFVIKTIRARAALRSPSPKEPTT